MSEARDSKPFLPQHISVGQLCEICVSSREMGRLPWHMAIDSVCQRDHVEKLISIWCSCYEIDLIVNADFES